MNQGKPASGWQGTRSSVSVGCHQRGRLGYLQRNILLFFFFFFPPSASDPSLREIAGNEFDCIGGFGRWVETALF